MSSPRIIRAVTLALVFGPVCRTCAGLKGARAHTASGQKPPCQTLPVLSALVRPSAVFSRVLSAFPPLIGPFRGGRVTCLSRGSLPSQLLYYRAPLELHLRTLTREHLAEHLPAKRGPVGRGATR